MLSIALLSKRESAKQRWSSEVRSMLVSEVNHTATRNVPYELLSMGLQAR